MRRPTLLIHIGLMILASVIIVLLALLWMNLFTHHGSSVEIPDIYGLPESEAEQLLDKAHLRYEIIDSVYTTEVPKGAVYDLTPKAGSKVKAGRIIFITLNAYYPRNGIIPSLIDVSERQARARLISLGFENITPSYVAGSFDGLVMGVQLPSGQTLAPGTRVPPFITLNAYYPRNGIIPSLIDVSERQARARLISLGFENITPSYVAGSFDGLVMGVQLPSGQTLAPGTRVPLSTPLILLISVSTRDSIPHGTLQPYDSITGSGGLAIPSDSTSHSLEPDDDESWM